MSPFITGPWGSWTRAFVEALAGPRDDGRRHRVVAIGVRADGVTVFARNGHPSLREPRSHAEQRLARKLTPRSVVYVARVNRAGVLRLAKPCADCHRVLVSRGVSRVHYTVNDTEHAELAL